MSRMGRSDHGTAARRPLNRAGSNLHPFPGASPPVARNYPENTSRTSEQGHPLGPITFTRMTEMTPFSNRLE